MEDSLLGVASHFLLAPHVSVLQQLLLQNPRHSYQLQTGIQIPIFAFVGVVDLSLAALSSNAIGIHGGLGQHFHWPVQEVASRINTCVQQVQGSIAVALPGPVLEQQLDPWWNDDCVDIQLERPVVPLVDSFTKNDLPCLDEHRGVQCMPRPFWTLRQLCPKHPLDHGHANLRRHDLVGEKLVRGDVADDGVGITREQAGAQNPLFEHQTRLRRARSHH
mmetsp:Transcript_34995/g.81178  ORF Transcript_34995/g.81178 Transcript_34995/m.81178 type:complete len:219 (-) Transcript_34995:1146-1802(-)